MMHLSKRAEQLKPSATLAMAAKAAKMRRDGIDVISFATGEPDFDTPAHICAAGKRGIDAGLTRYPPSRGTPELIDAIREKLARENGLSYEADEVAVSCGAKQAIYNALQVMVDPGDEVVLIAPYWVSYPAQVRLAGGEPVVVSTDAETNFKVTPAMLGSAITERTRAVILNSPCNPSGSAYTKAELAALGELLVERGVAVIADEIYEKLVYDGFVSTSIVAACPKLKAQTILINGVAKAYAMTGWRMGYAAGPASVIAKMISLSGQQLTGIAPFVQSACVEALSGPQEEVERMRAAFAERRDRMLELLRAIPDVRCHRPEGTFYLLPDLSAFIGRYAGEFAIADATALAQYLLEEGHIATVSGDAFGIPGHVRFSYATSMEQIEAGVARLADALGRLQK